MLSTVDEIKQKLDLVDVISEYVQLKPAGVNFRGLCPFHNEKTPSFIVSPEKQIWHCFGCGKGGDIFGFTKEIEGLEFVEALKILADKAGVKIKSYEPKLQSLKNDLWDLNKEITYFWQKNLWENPQTENIRNYLAGRGIKEEMAKEFLLGYASPEWEEGISFLKTKGYSEKQIFQAGLSVQSLKNQKFYDRFRKRIIFPIQDLHGNIVGFGGRIFNEAGTENKDEAKYLNSPQTEIYNKSQTLYGLDKARMEIKKKDYVIIVEGYMDLITAYQAGTKNIVASSGTALTIDQLRILKRYTNNLMMCFDADAAGQTAAARAIELAMGEDLNIKIITLIDAKDPDECIRKNKDAWFEAIKKAKHFVDYYFDQTLAKLDLGRSDHKKKAASILLGLISRLPNSIEQTHYLQKLAKILNVSEDTLREILVKKSQQNKKNPVKSEEIFIKKEYDKKLISSERLLAIGFKYPAYLKILIDSLEPTFINHSLLQDLYKLLVNYYNLNQYFTAQAFTQSLGEQDFIDEANKLMLLGEIEFAEWVDKEIHDEIINLINYLKREYYSQRSNEITEAIRISQKDGDESRLNLLREEYNKVMQERKKLK